ncbi:hypothetical protein [Nocardia sp. NPDC058705]|uniref:hypothetical protein n=1 Tax=Nocardia sp. NPDC058705 TaxID=3346609 RepID=UPI0036BFD2D4
MKVESAGFLYAEVVAYEKVTVLEVYRSIRVDLAGEVYAPVRTFLAANEHEQISEVEVEDPEMYGQKAIRTFYRLV